MCKQLFIPLVVKFTSFYGFVLTFYFRLVYSCAYGFLTMESACLRNYKKI